MHLLMFSGGLAVDFMQCGCGDKRNDGTRNENQMSSHTQKT